jgi:SnoaL-like domain
VNTPDASQSVGLDQIVRRLSDVETIKALKASYFRFLDLQRWHELSALFTSNASFHLETSADPVVFTSVAEWLSNLQRLLSGG